MLPHWKIRGILQSQTVVVGVKCKGVASDVLLKVSDDHKAEHQRILEGGSSFTHKQEMSDSILSILGPSLA